MKQEKERITITVDRTVLDVLRKQAKHDYRTVSQYINMILRRFAENTSFTDTEAQRGSPGPRF